MGKRFTRVRNPKLMAFIFGLAVLLLASGGSKVSAYAQKKDNPYLIKVNRVHNTITVYEKDEKGRYSIPVKAMVCSVGVAGTPTPLGTYQTQAKYRWKLLMGDVWGQYSTRIVGGVLFHSVYYYEYANPSTLATKQYNKLGTAASHGCIRLTVEDAKWIYDKCPVGTTVIIYDDKESPGPLGKPEAIKLPASVRWDPTDPDKKNPYYVAKEPTLEGVRYRSIFWGKEIDLLEGVSATSSFGTDITSDIVVKGEVNPFVAGKYEITYSVTDAFDRAVEKKAIVKVKECLEKPIIKGIKDRVVDGKTKIDKKFALSGVKVTCSGINLDSKYIKVKIDKNSKEEYKITYTIGVGTDIAVKKQATVYVDTQAPVISGLSELKLQPGQIPDQNFALEKISITDNYSSLDINDISIQINEIETGCYQIIYEVSDEVGNVTKEIVELESSL
ncbi:MAG: L,D-transpeptidase family protein [Clostridiales bacterium]|jgi:hypothetical protein|nr:L,D-transpeptidase family protein [Clostridiales bacterium]